MTTTHNRKEFFLLIDKSLGITSFDVIRSLRKSTNIKKIGHTGTLDPLATGALLVAFGNYTKLIPYFEKDSKEYEFELSLEGTTDSLDAETDLIPANPDIFSQLKKTLTKDQILKILEEKFHGEIEQIPPKYSALKIGGRKAVDLVRAGKTEDFEMKKRKITIHDIELLDFSFPKIMLRATVSAGTYIRTIAGDFGDIVGTGAHVTKLRRTKIGRLDVTHAINTDDTQLSDPLDIYDLFSKEKFITLPEDIVTRLNHGQRVRNDMNYTSGEFFLESEGVITHVIEVDEHLLKMKRKI